MLVATKEASWLGASYEGPFSPESAQKPASLQRHFLKSFNHGFHGFHGSGLESATAYPCHPCHPWSVFLDDSCSSHATDKTERVDCNASQGEQTNWGKGIPIGVRAHLFALIRLPESPPTVDCCSPRANPFSQRSLGKRVSVLQSIRILARGAVFSKAIEPQRSGDHRETLGDASLCSPLLCGSKQPHFWLRLRRAVIFRGNHEA